MKGLYRCTHYKKEKRKLDLFITSISTMRKVTIALIIISFMNLFIFVFIYNVYMCS
ncbi:hypothetical protein GLOIN_2v1547535 [Rhizophagus irregularis DAOM 181602=DAOM 197198]|uniref:Uncharacterized protein n=1 Tax=Rhizophagus irregularis (strain DAOM 181602 / DAOM 197198 / MUCL 43194) TaxID=747089 RepID=A0A2P4QIP5_RHIID|nr:hypothetical protein GLOIN_2v1547535 [Rhizophagus irregularis DAOM 181602=DAOM 197198]POG77511.1 hypothetical protein GLOIN_2v1547535 [Rhizophagus irregularis DAOM 181602=DAOM 197198]|eukprot:XP_025184377.1 hypothetical protein GLOIN_2v1547535 [Rhizophagus irregularis DAOM 181602=DAOM 197198]